MGLEFEGVDPVKNLNLVEEDCHKLCSHRRWHNQLRWGSSSR